MVPGNRRTPGKCRVCGGEFEVKEEWHSDRVDMCPTCYNELIDEYPEEYDDNDPFYEDEEEEDDEES